MGASEKVDKLVQKGKTDKVLKLVNDKHKETRLAAIEGLRNMPVSDDSINVLVDVAENDNDAQIRKEAIITLGCSNDNYAETHLRYCLTHEQDESVLNTIRETLDKMTKSDD